LKNVPTLTSLSLCKSEFTSDDAKLVSTAISKHKGLSFVDLSKCGLGGNEDNDILHTLLKGCKNLNGLDMSRNCFGHQHLAIIAKFVASHKKIAILNLEGNKFDDSSVASLNNALEKNKTLVELSLLHTSISLATKTQRSLVLNNNLMHIDLSCNDLGANGAKSIIKHLKKNPPLSMLSLVSCGLPSRSAKGLCNALKRNTNLAHLDLQSNSFNTIFCGCFEEEHISLNPRHAPQRYQGSERKKGAHQSCSLRSNKFTRLLNPIIHASCG